MVDEISSERTSRKKYLHCQIESEIQQPFSLQDVTHLVAVLHGLDPPCQFIKCILSVLFRIECIARMIDVFNHFRSKLSSSKGFERLKRERLWDNRMTMRLRRYEVQCHTPCPGMRMGVCGHFWRTHDDQEP
jgi:hypothetical protein